MILVRPDIGAGRRRVTTFYSREPGLGRSRAAASVGALLASWGERVLLVDLDLEGPGIERHFLEVSPPPGHGFVDLLEEAAVSRSLNWRQCVVEAPVAPDRPPVRLLAAAERDGRLAGRIERLEWHALFIESDLGTWLENLRNEWLQEHDFVLVNARADVSDITAIAMVYLPDIVVALFGPDHQDVEGVADIVRRARAARAELPFDRGQLVVLPTPAWDRSSNAYAQSGVGLRAIGEHLGELYRDVLPREVTVAEGLEVLRLPGGREPGYEERPTPEDREPVAPLRDAGPYTVLARLIGSGLQWDLATRPGGRSGPGAETMDFFISYSDADRQWAQWIAWLLERAGYRVLRWAWDFVPSGNVLERMGRGVRLARWTIAVLSPAYLASIYGGAEWQAAYAADPRGLERKLLPVRVASCRPAGPLSAIETIDLAGIDDEAEAARRVLDALVLVAGAPAQRLPEVLPGDVEGVGRPGFPRGLDAAGEEGEATDPGRGGGVPARRQARAGITGWVAARARGTPEQVRLLTGTHVAAAMTAAALAPLARRKATGGVGERLRLLLVAVTAEADAARDTPATKDDVRDALGAELLRRLPMPDEAGLRHEIATLLRSVGAVEVALTAAFDSGMEVLQERLARALVELGDQHAELARLGEDVLGALDTLQRGVTEAVFSGRHSAELNRDVLHRVTLLRQRLLASGETEDIQAGEEASPYPGLRPFQVGDARWFNGRGALTATLVNRVAERLSGPSLVMLVGASGAGKSSVINAGLLPALRSGMLAVPGSEAWPHLVMHPGATPLRNLLASVSELAEVTAGAVEAALLGGPAAFATILRRAAGSRAGRRLVLVVDQFEELFTRCSDRSERQAFIEALGMAARPVGLERPPAVVVLGLRADRYADCTAHPELMDLVEGGQVVAGPMTAAELREAIERPAEVAGLTLEPGLVDVILHDLDPRLDAGQHGAYDPGRLPLLSYALLATWQRRSAGKLDLAAYRAAGAIDRAITTTADRLHERLSPEERRVARDLLVRLVAVAENPADDARARVSRADLLQAGSHSDPGVADRVLDLLVGARLVTSGDDHFELTHEALLHAWPLLRGWLDEDRDWLVDRRGLSEAAANWMRARRDPSELYGKTSLTRVQDRLDDSRRAALGPREAAFLTASEERQRQLERSERWRVRRHYLLVPIALILIVTVGLSTAALVQRNVATTQRDVADSRAVAGLADQLRSADPGTAAQLGVAAYRISATAEAQSSLLATRAPFYSELPAAAGLNGVAASTDGDVLAGAGQDGSVELWSLRAQSRVRGTGGPVYAVALSPDGTTVAGGEQGGAVETWDVASGGRTAILPGSNLPVDAVAFSPDGHTLAVGGSDGSIRLWDLLSGAVLTLTGSAGSDGPVDAVAFSPDGRTLAVGGADRTIELWTVGDRKLAVTLRGHADPVRAVAFSLDSSLLASADDGGSILLWNLSAPGAPIAAQRTTGRVLSIAFMASGVLASGTDRGSVQLWRAVAGAGSALLPLTALAGPTVAVRGLAAFGQGGMLVAGTGKSVGLWDLSRSSLLMPSPTPPRLGVATAGGLLATTDADGRVRVWNRDAGTSWTVPDAGIDGLAMARGSDGGTLLATVASSEPVTVWNVPERRPVGSLPLGAKGQPAGALAFSPHGRLLAASSGGTVQVWDVRSLRLMRSIFVPFVGAAIDALAFSPDGGMLAAGGDDGGIRLIDTRTYQIVATLIGEAGAVDATAFSPDGTTIASGDARGNVWLWNVATRQPVWFVAGSAGAVMSVAFSPDGRTVASAGADRTTSLWNVSRRSPAPETLGAPADATAVVYAPDSSTLLGAGPNGDQVSWETAVDKVIARICASSGDLSAARWQVFVPADQPYRTTCS